MVRLKPRQNFYPGRFLICFNSTMVRLKLMQLKKGERRKKKFQFHNGSIKTVIIRDPNILEIVFQFHNGSIKTRSVP